MKIANYEVEQKVIDACLERMKSGEEFRSRDVEAVAYAAGAPVERAHRVADRLIQKCRHAKQIEVVRYPRWIWKK